MPHITIYPKDGGQNTISFSVKKITAGYTEGHVEDLVEFENADGTGGSVFINKEAILAVVISLATK